MSDLINRKALCEYALNQEDKSITPNDIMRFPSAEPDGIPLEWINRHLEWLDNCENDFAQLAKVSIRAMVELWKTDRI